MLLLIATLTTSTASIHTITSFAIAITRILFATITDIGLLRLLLLLRVVFPSHILLLLLILPLFFTALMRARCFKRFWEPLRVPRGWMPNNQQQYHANLQMRLSNQQPNTIMELERLVHSAAVSSMKCEQSRLVEPWEQDVFQHLLQQRKSSRDATERRALSKLIRKKLRSFQRQKQNQKITTTLEQFQDFGRLDALFHDPIKTFDMPATSRPSPEAFTECLSEIFTSSDVHVEACQSNIGFSTIPPFQLSELRQALRHMRNRRSGDDAGLVLEMFKLGCTTSRMLA